MAVKKVTVRTLVEFNDKRTNELHHVGDAFEVTKTRLNEILKVGDFVEEITEELSEEAPEEPEQ